MLTPAWEPLLARNQGISSSTPASTILACIRGFGGKEARGELIPGASFTATAVTGVEIILTG
jgi:hypothetical protein